MKVPPSRRVVCFLSAFICCVFILACYAGAASGKIRIDGVYTESVDLKPFTKSSAVNDLTLDAAIEFSAENSLIRVILVDDTDHEYMIYEGYPAVSPEMTFSVDNTCDETCTLDAVVPAILRLELINASVSGIKLGYGTDSKKRRIENAREKLKKVRAFIKKKQLKWQAGETFLSKMSYAEKKQYFGGEVPNTQAFNYYRSGVFRVAKVTNIDSQWQCRRTRTADSADTADLVSRFDWRNQHNAMDPSSPYYDNDNNGWMTPAKSQACNHCWAFSPTAALEGVVNVYYNQHLNLNLSEQVAASCSGGASLGTCRGGSIEGPINYFVQTGSVDENCFSYTRNDARCAQSCASPAERIQLSGAQLVTRTDAGIKRALLKYGPITGGVESFWHFMVIVGFDTEPTTGETIWIIKNSYGSDWGENGYVRLIVDLCDMYGLYLYETPLKSLKPHAIACNDLDRDGYYNWGISERPPTTCPANIPAEKDCNDADPSLAIMSANGSCGPGAGIVVPPNGQPAVGCTEALQNTAGADQASTALPANILILLSPILYRIYIIAVRRRKKK